MWYFFTEVQQILFVAYVLHAPTVAHCTLASSQMDLQCDTFWVPKGKNHNRKHERLLYLRQSLSFCSASGWLRCSVIPGTPHTPMCSIYGGRIPAAWSGKGIISRRYSGWWICRCCLCIPMATSPLSEELWCIKKGKKKNNLWAGPWCIKMLRGGMWGCLETPSGEIHSHHSHQHYWCKCYHFGGYCYSCHLPLCSHTLLDSIRHPCKTAMWCVCVPLRAHTWPIVKAAIVWAHDNVTECYMTSGTSLQTERSRGTQVKRQWDSLSLDDRREEPPSLIE